MAVTKQKIAIPQGVRREAAINALLDATAELLSKANRLDASLNEISKRAGVNSAMVKYYFGDKEGLLLALIDRQAETSMSNLSYLVARNISADEKLKIHIQGVMNTYHRAPYVNRLINCLIESGQPEVGERLIKAFIKPMTDMYREIIAQGVSEGSLRNVEPGFLYYAIVGAAEHIYYASYSVPAVLGVAEISVETKQDYTNMLVDVFLKGLKP